MAIIEKIKRFFLKKKLGKLSETAVTLVNGRYIKFSEPGPKTYGRAHMFESARLILSYVYGYDYERQLGLYSVGFNEDENLIHVRLVMFRPGVFIGKMGFLCDKTKMLFAEAFGKPVEIDIEEAKKRIYGFDSIEIY